MTIWSFALLLGNPILFYTWKVSSIGESWLITGDNDIVPSTVPTMRCSARTGGVDRTTGTRRGGKGQRVLKGYNYMVERVTIVNNHPR